MAEPLLKINGIPLWDGGRKIEMILRHAAEIHTALDGSCHIDYGGTHTSIKLSWSYLPGAIDGHMGRDDLYSIAYQLSPVTLSILDANGDYSELEVVAAPGSYQERLVFRVGNFWVWEVDLTFEEV